MLNTISASGRQQVTRSLRSFIRVFGDSVEKRRRKRFFTHSDPNDNVKLQSLIETASDQLYYT